MLCFYCTQTHIKLQSEFSRKLKKNNFRPFAAPSKCRPVRPAPPRYASMPSTRSISGWWHGGFFRPVLHYVLWKGIYTNKDTFFWNFFLKTGVRKNSHGISVVETCFKLTSTKFIKNNQKILYFWRFDLYQRPSSEEAGTRSSSSGSWRD